MIVGEDPVTKEEPEDTCLPVRPFLCQAYQASAIT
jgi:hypothetical protein